MNAKYAFLLMTLISFASFARAETFAEKLCGYVTEKKTVEKNGVVAARRTNCVQQTKHEPEESPVAASRRVCDWYARVHAQESAGLKVGTWAAWRKSELQSDCWLDANWLLKNSKLQQSTQTCMNQSTNERVARGVNMSKRVSINDRLTTCLSVAFQQIEPEAPPPGNNIAAARDAAR